MCVSLYVVLSICYTCRFGTRDCGTPGEISKSLNYSKCYNLLCMFGIWSFMLCVSALACMQVSICLFAYSLLNLLQTFVTFTFSLFFEDILSLKS